LSKIRWKNGKCEKVERREFMESVKKWKRIEQNLKKLGKHLMN